MNTRVHAFGGWFSSIYRMQLLRHSFWGLIELNALICYVINVSITSYVQRCNVTLFIPKLRWTLRCVMPLYNCTPVFHRLCFNSHVIGCELIPHDVFFLLSQFVGGVEIVLERTCNTEKPHRYLPLVSLIPAPSCMRSRRILNLYWHMTIIHHLLNTLNKQFTQTYLI